MQKKLDTLTLYLIQFILSAYTHTKYMSTFFKINCDFDVRCCCCILFNLFLVLYRKVAVLPSQGENRQLLFNIDDAPTTSLSLSLSFGVRFSLTFLIAFKNLASPCNVVDHDLPLHTGASVSVCVCPRCDYGNLLIFLRNPMKKKRKEEKKVRDTMRVQKHIRTLIFFTIIALAFFFSSLLISPALNV